MTTTAHSVCALDCPDACSVLVDIEDGRGTSLRGDPDHPFTRGFLCAKVTRYLEREYSPDRLLYPQRRVGAKGEGRFERISWDDAIETIATRLAEIAASDGAEAILPYSYGGTMGLVQGASMDRRFFHRLGASRLDRTICAAAGGAGLTQTLGNRHGTDPEQFRHAKLIIAWGANILGTNVHLWPFIVEARRNGARFYVIDPVRNRTGAAADKLFQLNPGSDLALALGLMHVIIDEGLEDADYVARYTSGFDELMGKVARYTPPRVSALTGLSVEEIVTLAREYATTRPAAIRANYGVQRSERGGAATRAIAMLPALTGSWRDVGGGLLMTTSSAFPLNRERLEMPELQPRPTRLVNMSELSHALNALDSPPVKALVVYNSNPAAVAPNQNGVLRGLTREDLFTVVLEQLETDTARHADILLPATTFLEHSDLYPSWGHHYLQLARPALPAPGEAKPNAEVFRMLARAMGFVEHCFRESDDEMMHTALDSSHPWLDGITLERLEREHSVRLNFGAEHFQPFASGGFGHPDGKCDLSPEGLDYVPPIESRLGDGSLTGRYPLELISPKADNGLNSTFGNRADVDARTATLAMHPADAERRKVGSGDRVRVFNARGSIELEARLDEAMKPGVVAARATRWSQLSPDRRNVNALTPERLTDIGGGPSFYSCLVEVESC